MISDITKTAPRLPSGHQGPSLTLSQEREKRQQQFHNYQDLAELLARYQHQRQDMEQRITWARTQGNHEALQALRLDQLKLNERIALLLWVTGFTETDECRDSA